jgi:hydrogenase maturation protein HypF
MFRDLAQLEEFAVLTDLERALLSGPERPIVLVKKKKELAPSVAPGLGRIGAFLPYTPLHHMILRDLKVPVVATSGNLSDEPIVKDNEEALSGLSKIADYLLLHNRDIRRRCDDSVVKVVGGVPVPLRRSRGYAPLPVKLPFKLKKRVLAVGGMLKNTFALGFKDTVILSQHIGDVENLSTLEVFEESVFDMMKLYEFEPEVVVCDLHPGYTTARWAEEFARDRGIPLVKVQHHVAHVLSCMAEGGVEGTTLGVAWDGTGYGTDGTVWGGEFLKVDYSGFERLFSFRPFRLLGGERAVREPRRVALSVLLEIFGEKEIDRIRGVLGDAFTDRELELLMTAWRRGINSPLCSSVGRLFDALASLLGIKHRTSYEGQAAMILEDLFDPTEKDSYPFEIEDGRVDWRPLFMAILEEKRKERAPSRFINTLARIVLEVALRTDLKVLCLSGGVFQNDPLVSRIRELTEGTFSLHTHQRVPPNDAGLALGQAVYRNRG